MRDAVVRYLLIPFCVTLALLAVALGAVSTYFFVRYGPELSGLRDAHVKLRKQIQASVDAPFLADISFAHRFDVRFKKTIPLEVPIRTKLQVPIDETFEIPIKDSFSVRLDRLFFIDEDIRVRSELPIDTVVRTRFLGIEIELPVKGVVPIDIVVPLREEMGIQGELSLHMTEPLPVVVRHELEVPIDLTVRGHLPVDEMITIPIDATLQGEIGIADPMPCTIEFDLSAGDWGEGVRLDR